MASSKVKSINWQARFVEANAAKFAARDALFVANDAAKAARAAYRVAQHDAVRAARAAAMDAIEALDFTGGAS